MDLFHHSHHETGKHELHHCGGRHKGVNYQIAHCTCGLHRINKRIAIGDTTNEKLVEKKVKIKFMDKCSEGGWHIESGVIVK